MNIKLLAKLNMAMEKFVKTECDSNMARTKCMESS